MSPGGALDASVTLDEVFTVLGAKRVPLAPELAGYLVLEIAEHADPSGGDVDPKSVLVGEEGTVALIKPRRDSASGNAEASVRSVLARLLDATGSQTPALAAASKRRSGAGLPALAEELETALIPVNRAAGRRALARLAREVRRVTLGVGRNALPSSSDLLSGGARRSQPTLPPPSAPPSAPPSHRPNSLAARTASSDWEQMPTTQLPSQHALSSEADVDVLLDQFSVSPGDQHHARELQAIAGIDGTPGAPQAAGSERSRVIPEVAQRPSHGSVLPFREPTTTRKPSTESGLPSWEGPAARGRLRPAGTSANPARLGRSRGRGLLPIVAVLAAGGGAYAVWQLRPTPRGSRDLAAEATASVVAAASSPPARPVAACTGALQVSGAPARAEILLRVGQAPVDVERMPVGTRLEFVATVDGYAPKRVVIPAGTTWDTGEGGKPRFEAAVQLDKVTKANAEFWPPGEPGSEVGGQGPPGTVHVVATPRGAEVWMLAGLGPEARIEQLRCDRGLDVLVAGPTNYRRRIHVAAADFQADADPAGNTLARTAHVTVR